MRDDVAIEFAGVPCVGFAGCLEGTATFVAHAVADGPTRPALHAARRVRDDLAKPSLVFFVDAVHLGREPVDIDRGEDGPADQGEALALAAASGERDRAARPEQGRPRTEAREIRRGGLE